MRNLNFELTKRHKIILTSVFVTLGFLFITHTVNIVFRRYYLIFILAFFAYILSLWSLWKGMTKTKAVVLLILPVFYCLAALGFYFLFREIRWLTRLPVAIFFGLSYYCLLLAQNVFNVASDRTIPLYRAASAVNFVYTVFTMLLINSIIFTLHLQFYWNGVVVFLFSFLLVFQALWSIKIEKITVQTIVYALVISLMLGEVAMAASFLNILPHVRALIVLPINYILLGIITDYIQGRMNKKDTFSYISIGGAVFITFIFLSVVTNIFVP